MSEKNLSRSKLLIKLFLVNFYISAFTFGGGFVIITFMKRKYVDELHWISEEEMLDMTAIAQSSPGAIAVNAAVLVGKKVAGAWGIAASVLGTILPPMIVLSVISMFYQAFASNKYVALVLTGMKAGVAAVIMDVVYKLGTTAVKENTLVSVAEMIAVFILVFFLKVNVIYIIAGAAVLGIITGAVKRRAAKAKTADSQKKEDGGV